MNDDFVEETAERICRLKLQEPAVFFLELYKPLVGLFHSAVIVAQPVLGVLVGAGRAEKLRRFLEERGNVEKLISCIEGRISARR